MFMHHLQLKAFSFVVAPISLVVFSLTIYRPPSVMLKLQFIFDGVRLEHSSADTRAGPSTSTVTVSIGGVYTDDDPVPYWMERHECTTVSSGIQTSLRVKNVEARIVQLPANNGIHSHKMNDRWIVAS